MIEIQISRQAWTFWQQQQGVRTIVKAAAFDGCTFLRSFETPTVAMTCYNVKAFLESREQQLQQAA